VRAVFSAVSIYAQRDPSCAFIAYDPCLINAARWDALFIDDYICHGPRVEASPIAALLDELSVPASPAATPTATATPTPTVAVACIGDCNHDGAVTVEELIVGVNMVLGNVPLSRCPEFETPVHGLDVTGLVQAASKALYGCELGCWEDAECTAPAYCAKPAGDCTGAGQCTLRPTVFCLIVLPVCGCDGQNYQSNCVAAYSGVNVAHDGDCP
jgi:hypothetical protein